MINNKLKMFFFLMIVTMLFNISALSQSGTSIVTGTITDAQGNVVPGATVTLYSQLGSSRSATTNNNGTYTFASLQPGEYRIEVESSGFKKASVSTFQALVDKTTDISLKLEVGAVTETVTVDTTSIENIINTQDASIGNNFVAKQIEQLPLQGRNVANLLSLQAAVTPDGSVAGGRSDQANITLDGIDVNNQQTGEAFTPVLRVNPDSVDEFRVTTSNPDASKGRSSGAQIALITKGGTNQFRGALYEYHRNTITTANNYFNNLNGVERPKLIRNLFGARIGGPIIKDKFFFFYNYEGMREAKQTAVSRAVPLPSLAAGSLRFQDNTGVQRTVTLAEINALTLNGQAVVNVNPAVLAVFQDAVSRYPANDIAAGNLNTATYRFNAAAPVNQNMHTARFDWNITNDTRHTFSLRGNYQQDVESGTPMFPDTPGTNFWSHPLGFVGTHTWLINNNMTNRISFGLTRLATSTQGDSDQNNIQFRGAFSPFLFARTADRVNPTYNITDDFTWIKGNHTLQFGGNARIIRNKRRNFGAAFDSGLTNGSTYEGAEAGVLAPLNEYLLATYGTTVGSAWEIDVSWNLANLFGRLTQYNANFNFGLDGSPIASGQPVVREWATEEYDFYIQDSWRVKPNLTINLGLRYGLSRPVYETQGFQVAPNIPLQEYFANRTAAAAAGINYDLPLTMELVGPRNNGRNFYDWDDNNLQPRISFAWSPNFQSGFLSKVFGTEQQSVIRGGFAITNDYFGQQLAVTFDNGNPLGFSTSLASAPFAFNVLDCPVATATCRPAPLYTGPGQNIKALPGITAPGNLTFPLQFPQDGARRIEQSLDTNLKSPINYTWNLSYGRNLPGKSYLEVSYVARLARNLLATRDVMQPNNIKDPISGQTWYDAARLLEEHRRAGGVWQTLQPIPFFENMYTPGSLGAAYGIPTNTNTQLAFRLGRDYTGVQDGLDAVKPLFFQSQYAAMSSFGTFAQSDYHGMAVTYRQRLVNQLTWDLNYTWSKSMDTASGLQTSGIYGTAFVLNALTPEDRYAISDFDMTHIINANAIWDIPIGRGRSHLSGIGKVLDAIIGGWQLSSIFRYDNGYPAAGAFVDGTGWQTNWQIRSTAVRVNDVTTSPTKLGGVNGDRPNIFSDRNAVYSSFRSPFAGESGDRNIIRFPSYFVVDAGLAKSFSAPWSENHKAWFRWDVFNVTNSARFTGLANSTIGVNPGTGLPQPTFGNFTGQRGAPRIMQFALRYEF